MTAHHKVTGTPDWLTNYRDMSKDENVDNLVGHQCIYTLKLNYFQVCDSASFPRVTVETNSDICESKIDYIIMISEYYLC